MHSQFGDCSTEKGLKALNDHLATRSYVEGFGPSAADAAPFAEVGKATHGAVTAFPHVTRWYMHIKSFPEFAGSASSAAPKHDNKKKEETPKKEEKKKEEKKPAADEDDIDLFGEEDEEEAAAREADKEKKRAEAAAKNKKDKNVIAKSSIILDVKPWDDETDMVEMEKLVRGIEMQGLTWGWSKLVPVGYGIKKLQINCVVVDDDVSVDDLEEKITAFEDHVQSMDIHAFNKI